MEDCYAMFIDGDKMVEKIINIPEGVEIAVDEREILVKGPKGEIRKNFDYPRYNKVVSISRSVNAVKVSSESDKRKIKAIVGTFSRHISNMILGVTKGFRCTMKVYYSHFPISVSVKGNEVHIKNFIGEKGARVANIVGSVSVNVGKDEIIVSGTDVESVGQTAANIEQACALSRRDRRIFQDGIFISEKSLEAK